MFIALYQVRIESRQATTNTDTHESDGEDGDEILL